MTGGGADSSIALLREGYAFIPRRCRRLGTDVFATRLMLRRAVCMSGPQAARLFYGNHRFTRRRALPPTALTLLQDRGSVALLDGAAHAHRKQMFLEVMGPGRFDRLLGAATSHWQAAATRWRRSGEVVVLHEAAQEILCRAACRWAGVPLGEGEAPARTRELAGMIDGAGALGPRQWRGQLLRRRGERWARAVVGCVRRGELDPPAGSPAHVIAWHRDRDGDLLHPAVAAVELINVLRPTLAVARYVTFAALALHEHPAMRARLRDGGPGEREEFVQEVRRFYPFFPLVAGRVAEPFEWRGHRFSEGLRVLLDLYGTNHDPRAWDAPERFRPERFRGWGGDPFTLIPQGGGDHLAGHRCPGEWVTIELTKLAVEFLVESIAYEVPAQDLSISLSRMPTLPRSGLRIARVRAPR